MDRDISSFLHNLAEEIKSDKNTEVQKAIILSDTIAKEADRFIALMHLVKDISPALYQSTLSALIFATADNMDEAYRIVELLKKDFMDFEKEIIKRN